VIENPSTEDEKVEEKSSEKEKEKITDNEKLCQNGESFVEKESEEKLFSEKKVEPEEEKERNSKNQRINQEKRDVSENSSDDETENLINKISELYTFSIADEMDLMTLNIVNRGKSPDAIQGPGDEEEYSSEESFEYTVDSNDSDRKKYKRLRKKEKKVRIFGKVTYDTGSEFSATEDTGSAIIQFKPNPLYLQTSPSQERDYESNENIPELLLAQRDDIDLVQPYSSPFPPTSSSISLLHCDEEVIENMSPPQEKTNAVDGK